MPQPTIEIPRLDDETTRAYAARVAYLTMGAGRSLGQLRGQAGGKTGVSTRLSTLEEWSARYSWVDHARRYDETLAALAAQQHAEEYRAELDQHRADAMQAGRDLYTAAQTMLTKLNSSAETVEYTPASLSAIARAFVASLDLQAHALRVADVLPRLENADQPD